MNVSDTPSRYHPQRKSEIKARQVVTKLQIKVEAFTDGTDRRAYGRAKVHQIAQNVFVVIPFYVREISGPVIQWTVPPIGRPLLTKEPITSFTEASDVFKTWLMRTFAENAQMLP